MRGSEGDTGLCTVLIVSSLGDENPCMTLTDKILCPS